jgi:hypothetical protein
MSSGAAAAEAHGDPHGRRSQNRAEGLSKHQLAVVGATSRPVLQSIQGVEQSHPEVRTAGK